VGFLARQRPPKQFRRLTISMPTSRYQPGRQRLVDFVYGAAGAALTRTASWLTPGPRSTGVSQPMRSLDVSLNVARAASFRTKVDPVAFRRAIPEKQGASGVAEN
jgi:hypothetical protein